MSRKVNLRYAWTPAPPPTANDLAAAAAAAPRQPLALAAGGWQGGRQGPSPGASEPPGAAACPPASEVANYSWHHFLRGRRRRCSWPIAFYRRLLAEQCAAGELARAEKVIRFMRAEHIPVDEQTYDVVIWSLAEARLPQAALQACADMRRAGLRRSAVTYSGLISACCRGGWAEGARRCLSAMLQDGVAPDRATLTHFLTGCAELKAFDEVAAGFASLAHQRRQVATDLWHLLAQRVLAEGSVAQVWAAFETLCGQRVRLVSSICEGTITRLLAAGRVSDAQQVAQQASACWVSLSRAHWLALQRAGQVRVGSAGPARPPRWGTGVAAPAWPPGPALRLPRLPSGAS